MFNFIANRMSWMYWTTPSIIFIGGIFVAITVVGILESFVTVVERKGFLPIPTTPGDRLFISILYLIAVFLLWLAIFKQQLLLIPAAIAAGGVVIIFWKG